MVKEGTPLDAKQGDPLPALSGQEVKELKRFNTGEKEAFFKGQRTVDYRFLDITKSNSIKRENLDKDEPKDISSKQLTAVKKGGASGLPGPLLRPPFLGHSRYNGQRHRHGL